VSKALLQFKSGQKITMECCCRSCEGQFMTGVLGEKRRIRPPFPDNRRFQWPPGAHVRYFELSKPYPTCGKCETSFSSIARVAGYFLDDEEPVTVDSERTNDANDNYRPNE